MGNGKLQRPLAGRQQTMNLPPTSLPGPCITKIGAMDALPPPPPYPEPAAQEYQTTPMQGTNMFSYFIKYFHRIFLHILPET